MVVPMENCHNYADVLTWESNKRFELYYGHPIIHEPPTPTHAEISGAISLQLYNYSQHNEKKSAVYGLPVDIKLFAKDGDYPEDINTVLQPDIWAVCDSKRLDEHGLYGAPDLVIEVLSKSTQRYDRVIKFQMYQRAGVKEYWIVDPDKKLVLVHILDEGQYPSPEVYTAKDTVPVGVLEDCSVDLNAVFPEE